MGIIHACSCLMPMAKICVMSFMFVFVGWIIFSGIPAEQGVPGNVMQFGFWHRTFLVYLQYLREYLFDNVGNNNV